MKRKHKKTISWIIILFFSYLTLTINISFPQRAFAEGLAISGLQCKTTEFRPYLEKGQFSCFLNQPASVTAEIQDNDFNLVRKIQFMKMEEAGENIIMWDGKDEEDNFIKDGEYFLSVSAMGGQAISVASSIGMKMAFDAPMGTEFKGHISQIKGKEKKQYPSETPTKLQSKNWGRTCLGGSFLELFWSPIFTAEIILWVFTFGTATDIYRDFKDNFFSAKAQKEALGLERVPNYEKYEKIKKEVDKHNAKIDEEIANENRKIDAYNQKIKDSVRIRISLTD